MIVQYGKGYTIIHLESLVCCLLVVMNIESDVTVVDNFRNNFVRAGQKDLPDRNVINEFSTFANHIDYINGFAVFSYLADMINGHTHSPILANSDIVRRH